MEALKQKAIESLKKQFEEVPKNEHGYRQQIIINNCLIPELNNNPEFAERILIEGKSTEKLESKIVDWIKQSKNYSPSHNIIFSAAIHYYQEDDPEFVKEIFEEEPIEFGNVEKDFDTPMIKYITGTVIKEVIKEVIKKPKSSSDDITRKVSKTIKANSKNISKQVDIFEVLEDEDIQKRS